jgi:hypothetical protein
MIKPANFERHIGECENKRTGCDGVGIAGAPTARHRIGQQQRQHRRKGIAEQQEVEEHTADVGGPEDRRLQQHQAERGGEAGKHREQDRADVMDDAAGSDAQPLQADRHRQRHAYLQRDLGKAGGACVNIPAVDEVANFHERQQHRKQDCRRFHRS